jgi:diguanylate cyclase (GGDEF)-like protein
MQNQRQFVRLKTRQEARVRFADDQSLTCEIRDFCPTGFYLRRLQSDAAGGLEPSPAAPSVVVEFAASARHPPHRVPGRIAHQTEAGLGIYVEAMPDIAFQALLEFRAGLYKSARDAEEDQLDPVDALTVRTQCLSLFRPFLQRVISDFFCILNEREAKEYRPGGGPIEQAQVVGSLAHIRLNQNEIERRYVETALKQAEETIKPGAAGGSGRREAQLSLVEDDEFNDWLNIAAIVNKLEVSLRRQLGHFERLYGLLSLRGGEGSGEASFAQGVPGQSSPFSPDPLCRAFQSTLDGFMLTQTQRVPLYQAFSEAVARHAPSFYEQLGRLAAVADRRGARAGGPGRAEDSLILEGPELPDLAPTRTLFSADVATPEPIPFRLDEGLTAFNATAAGASPASSPVGSTRAAEAARHAAMLQGQYNSLQTASLLGQVLGQLTPPPLQAAAPAGSDSQAQLPVASTNEVLLALDALLQTRQIGPGGPGLPSLADQLRLRLSQVSGAAVRIQPEQQRLLDSLAGLFGQVMGEYSPASQLEALMKRFEAPFFKLAMRDPDFLVSEGHPARQVINLLDQFAIAADDNGKFFDAKLLQVLTAMVDNLLAKADQEPEIYARTAEALAKMLSPLRKVRTQRVQRLQEASEGKQRILGARVRVLNEMEARLGGRDVPRLILRLLDTGWRHYLSLIELRQGIGDEAWQRGIGAVERLLDWLSPGFVPGPDYVMQVAELRREIGQGLATVCLDADHLESTLAELEATLTSRMRDPNVELERVHLEPGMILRGYQDEGCDLPEDNKLRAQLALGTWWNLASESDRQAPMQLMWLSHPPGSCAFANRSATRKVELSLAELSRRVEAGLAEPATDKGQPILERSENALVDVVYKHLARQTTHDPVTDLINRKSLIQHLRQAAGSADLAQPHTLCVLEFDQFRVISHQHGVVARDDLMRQLAAEVQARLRPDDVLAALGGDSIAAYLPACGISEGRKVMGELVEWLKDFRFQRDRDSHSIGVNIGLVEFFPGEIEPDEVLRRADAACMRATSMGRNQMQFYASDDAGLRGQESLMEWAGRIDKILDRDGLYLRCQLVSPVNASSDLKPYYEILLGVRDPDGAEVGPLHFIQAVERWNRVHDIDLWVVGSVFQWIRGNPDTFAGIGGFSINLSAQSLNNEELLAFLHRELGKPDLPVEKIMFEITETGTIGSYAAAQDFIQQIRRYGCRFCIDDFGSGYASYGHLKNLQTDTLKIDGIFIKDILENPADYAMAKSMTEIGHSLGMHVVAEFVATPEILAAVRDIGVDYAQGYALHKPMPIEGLAAAVAAAAAE